MYLKTILQASNISCKQMPTILEWIFAFFCWNWACQRWLFFRHNNIKLCKGKDIAIEVLISLLRIPCYKFTSLFYSMTKKPNVIIHIKQHQMVQLLPIIKSYFYDALCFIESNYWWFFMRLLSHYRNELSI